jgi:hypothetical protein
MPKAATQARNQMSAARSGEKARPKHKFVVSHARDADFKAGLRPYAHYRDLGIAAATGGMAEAHVIRFVPPFRRRSRRRRISTRSTSSSSMC